MDKEKKTLAAVGVLGALAAVLFLRKKAEAAPQMDAAITIRVLDSAGNEVPHNSPVLLDPGEYTVEVTVTNQSLYLAEPTEAVLTTRIEAVINGTELIPPTARADNYGPNQSLVMPWPLIVPFDAPAASGAIVVDVLDPNGKKLAEASQALDTTGPRREAIDGIGDLNDDGLVSHEDADILNLFIANASAIFAGNLPLSDITPANIPLWEFLRRADMNANIKVDIQDKFFMLQFMHEGVLPEPEIGSREAPANQMGDLNDDGYVDFVDVWIITYAGLFKDPISIWSPLSEAEFMRRADWNGDGVIDVVDLLRTQRWIRDGEVPVDYAADLDMGID